METEQLNRQKVVLAEKMRSNNWLAEQLGKDQDTISNWVTNTYQPDLKTLIKLVELLNVELTELVRIPKK